MQTFPRQDSIVLTMGTKTYRQLCGVAKALDLVGERWTLLIIRDLLLGPASYCSLLDGLPGLTTNLLAKRLRDLTQAGLIEAIVVDAAETGGAVRGLYGLTAAGNALGPIIGQLGNWGREHGPSPTAGDQMNFRWLPVFLGRNYKQTGQRWIVQLNSGEKSLQVRLGTEQFESVEGTPMKPDLLVQADCMGLHALLFGEENPDQLLQSGRIELLGTESVREPAWADFLDSFALREE
ncbi:MAG: DNA-binding HxlR family transcriptional regulator [Planctomycetota bacterium]|jgi:DNA-binding HxlR family transcriptional regulator